jgi:hypothetical protein
MACCSAGTCRACGEFFCDCAITFSLIKATQLN